MNETAEVQAKPWQLLWQPLPDEGAEYQRDAIAEAQATRPDDEQPEDMG
jgi:hypothetical protein